jgi:hypothetical protein
MTRVINGVPTRLVLGSYGLIVNPGGMLESPANTTSPCRQINWVLAPVAVCRFPEIDVPAGIPCGYMGMWMRRNHAIDTLTELYTSAYLREAAYGSQSQGASGVAQLVVNEKRNGQKSTVGMSMVPSIESSMNAVKFAATFPRPIDDDLIITSILDRLRRLYQPYGNPPHMTKGGWR